MINLNRFIFVIILLLSIHSNSQCQDDKYDTNGISISVVLPAKKTVLLNIYNSNLASYPLVFQNSTDDKKIIKRYIPRTQKYQEIRHLRSLVRVRQYFVIREQYNEVQFEYDTQNQTLIPLSESIADYSIFDKDYHSFMRFINRDMGKSSKYTIDRKKKELEELYLSYKKTYESNPFLTKLNTIRYYSTLQLLMPDNQNVKRFLYNVSASTLFVESLRSLFFSHIKNNFDSLDFERLNTQNYNEGFIKYFSIGAYSFLKNKENKDNPRFRPLIDWFVTTGLYKDDVGRIRKDIFPVDKKVFKNKLLKLTLQDVFQEELSIVEITEKVSADFYLLDIWATWCGPCIEGFKIMEGLDLPENLKVIKISTDQKEYETKWRAMSQRLDLEYSYHLPIDYLSSQEFFELLELRSVPRYILVDKEMNLIDEAFYQPHEPKFIESLQTFCVDE